jgi:hypothetical protein
VIAPERLMGPRTLSTTILPPPGSALAVAPGMANAARKLSLVSNDDRREVPTEPHNLKPSETRSLKVAIPRLQPLPQELIDAIRKLPEPNPLSYVDMSCALILRGLERQQGIDAMLDAAVDRINEDAEARAAAHTKAIKGDIDITNGQMQSLAKSVAELEATVTQQLLPRTNASEEAVTALRTELADVRQKFENEISRLEELIASSLLRK